MQNVTNILSIQKMTTKQSKKSKVLDIDKDVLPKFSSETINQQKTRKTSGLCFPEFLKHADNKIESFDETLPPISLDENDKLEEMIEHGNKQNQIDDLDKTLPPTFGAKK